MKGFRNKCMEQCCVSQITFQSSNKMSFLLCEYFFKLRNTTTSFVQGKNFSSSWTILLGCRNVSRPVVMAINVSNQDRDANKRESRHPMSLHTRWFDLDVLVLKAQELCWRTKVLSFISYVSFAMPATLKSLLVNLNNSCDIE